MRLFDLNENVTKEITEATWKYRLHLKDIFKKFQDEKISLSQAKSLIASRIEKFLADETLEDSAEEAMKELVALIKKEGDVTKIDDLINTLYDIADEHSILVR